MRVTSKKDDDKLELLGNQGTHVCQFLDHYIIMFTIILQMSSFILICILTVINTSDIITLCPPINISKTTSVTLNAASSTCNPIVDAQRLQDVIDAHLLAYDTQGYTCDIAWQNSERKFNESCTELDLKMTSSESTINIMLYDDDIYPKRMRIDGIKWNSMGKWLTMSFKIAIIELLVFLISYVIMSIISHSDKYKGLSVLSDSKGLLM